MTGLRSEFYVLVEGTILLDCCAARKKALEKEWAVKVLAETVNPDRPVRHCLLGCCRSS